ncbi:MAG: hypothetical protein P8N09_09890 [Planctomycetota bacterium]|nr:hypothetical protein [Planctomycetota bacterium]
MLRLVRLTLLATICLSSNSFATQPDVILQGTQPLNHSYSFVGLDAFPEHRFLIVPQNFGAWQAIEEGEPVSWYKFSDTRLYAVDLDFEVPPPETTPDLALLKGFPKSTIEMGIESALPLGSLADSRKTVYRVVALSEAEVELELVSDEYLNASGEIVSPTPTSALVSYLPYLAGVGLILLIVIRRRRR